MKKETEARIEAPPLFDSPLVSLSLKGEGEYLIKRGANAPLKHPL